MLVNEHYHLLNPLRPFDAYKPTEVFEVVDEAGSHLWQAGTHLILKVLRSHDSKLVELLEREAIVLQLIEHPGIPRCDVDSFFDFTPENGSSLYCLAIEKIEGQPLDQWLSSGGHLSQQKALEWLKQLVEILDVVHRARFFHRDIKPSNIILRPDGRLALIDFGAVREVSDTYLAKVGMGLTRTSSDGFFDVTIVRTACYAPLEQINGKAVPQSDFYALGRTFAHLLTGTELIQLREDPKTGKLLWREKAPQVDKPFADFLDWLMAPAPGNRPQNTQVLLQYLKNRLPRQLKRYQMRRSPQFRIGLVMLGALSVFGVYKVSSLAAYWYYFTVGLQIHGSPLPGSDQVARGYYEKALKFNPTSINAHLNLADVCQELEDENCARREYQKAVELDPNDPETRYNLGVYYDLQNKYAWAEAEFKKAMDLGADQDGIVSAALARLKNRQKDYNAALPYAQQAVDKADDPQAQAIALKNFGWTLLGIAQSQQCSQQAQQCYQKAQKQLELSIEQDSTRPDAYCLLAQAQEGQDNNEDASGNWRECLQRNNFLDLPEVNQWRDQVLNRTYKTPANSLP